MIVTLNLASRPYVDLRATLRRLRSLMVILALVAVALFALLHFEQKKATVATARVEAVDNRVNTLERQQRGYEALMREPQNAVVLNQADYLNSLFRRKAFSWTATMTDLETVLPQGVQVLSLDPAITKSGDVQIHLRVSGARDRAIELVQNLEKSRHFANTRIVGEAQAQGSEQNGAVQPVSASTLVNFDILADYRPVSPGENASAEHQPQSSARRSESPARKRGTR